MLVKPGHMLYNGWSPREIIHFILCEWRMNDSAENYGDLAPCRHRTWYRDTVILVTCSVLFLKSMPLVKVQKNVDFTDFTALSRNFQIIYIFKSCKYSMRFVVQVCLDHAAHIYIWKVKNTESKLCIGSNQLIRVYSLYTCAGHAASTVLCAKRSRCMYTTTLAVTACTVGIYACLSPHRCILTYTRHISIAECVCETWPSTLRYPNVECTLASFSRNCRIQEWPCTCITNSDQLIVSDAKCFDSVFFTFHM